MENKEKIEELTEDEIQKKTNEDNNDTDNVTREINLDDLYDGAVNNTVVIDPVTNDEVLLPNRKTNHTFIGILLAVIVLLLLYYVTTKTDLGRTTPDLEPKTTTTIAPIIKNENQTLTCSYTSESNSENANISFLANGVNDNVLTSEFNYSVILTSDTASAIETDLSAQYENLYITNAAVKGIITTFEKNEKGFTFNSNTDYKVADFNSFLTTEGQTVSFVKPTSSDTITSLKDIYTNKGYTCTVVNNEE